LLKKICLHLAICFVLVSIPSGCGTSPDDLYKEGKTLIQERETLSEGISVLKRFEKKFPDDPRTPEVMIALALAFQGDKQLDKAEATFERLIDTYSGTAEAYKGMFLLAYLYYDEMQNEEKTRSILDSFIETYPDSELAVSAKVLLDNIGIPVDEWSTVRSIGLTDSVSTEETR